MKYCWILLGATLLRAAEPWELRLEGPRVFKQRELIRIGSNRPRLDEPQSRFAGFLIHPAPAGCGTGAKPCVSLRPMMAIRSGPAPVEPPPFILNDYVRDLPPGKYAVAAVLEGRSQNFVSNTVEIEVQPADATWVAEQVARSVAYLRNGGIEAAEQLGLLDVAESWRASLDVLPAGEPTLLMRLTDTREPDKVCQLMQTRVPAPEQSVSRYYLETLTQICKKANVEADASATLAGSVARKQPQVKMAALQALVEYVQQKQSADPPLPEPAWAPGFYREFARSYGGLDVNRRPFLLSMFASTAPTGTVVPLLESALNAWKPGDYYEAAHNAIRALHALDRPRAHKRLLTELRRPKRWLDVPLLALLPASVVPPMDDVLLQGGWNEQLSKAAIAKYATPEALGRIKAIYESQQDKCQPELMAYFVRVEPAFADRLLQSQMSEMHAPAPPCTTQYFARTSPLAMHPVLEKYIAAYLNHGTVIVKMLAARALGHYGSPAAREPLWAAYRYFHEYWKGKKTALEENGEGVVLEVELRNALSRGTNWLTSDAELRTIESLCISDQCLSETQGDLRASRPPLEIHLHDGVFGLHGSVGHYIGLQGIDAIRARLAQYPRGAAFKVSAHGLLARRAAAELRVNAVR